MFRRILAAVDSSPRAPGVLAVARDLAARYSARLHLYHAVFVPPDIPSAGHLEGDHLRSRRRCHLVARRS